MKAQIRTKYSMTHLLRILGMSKSTQWLSTHTSNASNAISLTSEEEKVALRPWVTRKQEKNSTPKNLSALVAVQSKQQTARSTAKSTSHSNADSAVQSVNGSAGETRIFVMDVIRSKLQDSIFREYQRTSCLSARGKQSALLEANMEETARNFVSDVEFAAEIGLTSKTFDFGVLSIIKHEYEALFNPLEILASRSLIH